MNFELKIALRFLREGRTQSTLIIGGVTVGVAVVVFISALTAGMQDNTIRRTLGAQAHIVAKPIEPIVRTQIDSSNTSISVVQTAPRRVRSIDNWQQIMAAYESTPGVLFVSPMASGAGIAIRGEARNSVTVYGIDLQRYDRVVDLREKLTSGTLSLEPGDVLIGAELAIELGATVGDRITLSDGLRTQGEQLLIKGTIDPGNRELSRRAVYLPLHVAQNFLGLAGGVTSIDMRVSNVFDANSITTKLARITPLTVESWMTTNGQILSALIAQDMATGMIRVFVSIVVMLGIASVLVVAVVQKTREIGILRAMGASRGQMTRVFLFQGALVGLIGSMLATVLAAVLVFLFSTVINIFPISLTLPLLIYACATATFCGIVSAIAPARRAAKLDPALAMRT